MDWTRGVARLVPGVLLSVVLAAACSSDSGLPFVDLSERAPTTSTGRTGVEPVRIAIAAILSPQGNVSSYGGLANYLAQRLGMQVTASIEPKPGIPPSPGDVARVVKKMRDEGVKVILTAAWSNNRQIADIARKAGAKVIELPNQVKGASWASDWIALMDGVHTRLAKAFDLELL